jgi:multiple sugar transport system substrate-binding protein
MPVQDDPRITQATMGFLTYLYSPNAYITFLHMAVGGMMPVLKGVGETERFLNDPKGVYSRYGADKIREINEGLDNIESFGIVEGTRIEAASTIYSKKIIPQMIYKITQEGMDVDRAMAWAEAEMKKLLK